MHFRSENLPRPGPQLDLPFWSVNVSPSKCPSRCFAWDEKQCGIRWRPKACPSFGIATLFSSSDGCRGPQWHYTLFPFDCMLMYANMRVSGFEGREGREDCTGMKFCSARPAGGREGGRCGRRHCQPQRLGPCKWKERGATKMAEAEDDGGGVTDNLFFLSHSTSSHEVSKVGPPLRRSTRGLVTWLGKEKCIKLKMSLAEH